MRFDGVVVTCEHASARVPAAFREQLSSAKLLSSHRGSDLGAARVAKAMARALDAPLFLGRFTRLLVDLNRSPGHPRLMSAPIAALPRDVRDDIVARYYTPHRVAVTAAIRAAMGARGRALHLAVHSFTPAVDGAARTADIGLLYDPSRSLERAFVDRLRVALADGETGALRVRRNYPYRGVSDGLCTALRAALPARRYVGLELELNQAWATGAAASSITRQLVGVIVDAID